MDDIQLSRAKRISQLHTEIENHLKTSLEKAIEIGGLLSEQKASLGHGDFGRWIRSIFPSPTAPPETT